MISEPDEKLIRRCQDGDMEAFNHLYRHYEKSVYGLCLRMLNNLQDAEDAMQSIFIKIYRHISNFKFHSSFTTYLMRIAYNACFDMLHRRKIKSMNLQDIPHPPYQMETMDYQIERAIARLPERSRACFVLFAVEGIPQEKIARILKIRTGTVKALIFQARRKLQSWLEEDK